MFVYKAPNFSFRVIVQSLSASSIAPFIRLSTSSSMLFLSLLIFLIYLAYLALLLSATSMRSIKSQIQLFEFEIFCSNCFYISLITSIRFLLFSLTYFRLPTNPLQDMNSNSMLSNVFLWLARTSQDDSNFSFVSSSSILIDLRSCWLSISYSVSSLILPRPSAPSLLYLDFEIDISDFL